MAFRHILPVLQGRRITSDAANSGMTMKEASQQKTGQQKTGMSETLSEARTGLFRATLLFGAIAIALALIVVPTADRHAKLAVAEHAEGLDQIVTGSNRDASKRYVETRSVLWDAKHGPCLLFPDGSQRGAC